MNIILLVVTLFFSLFALYFEVTEYHHAYMYSKHNPKDRIKVSLKKLEKTISYDRKTIKWRSMFLATNITILLLFGIYYRKVPSDKEYIIHLTFIFLIFYITRQLYCSIISKQAINIGMDNIKHIKKILETNNKFIV